MGYLFLLISVLAGNTKGYCGKRISGYTRSLDAALRISTVRMLLCVPIALLLVSIFGDAVHLTLNPTLVFSSLLSGASTAIFVVTWLFSARRAAYMLVDVFLMLGVGVPLLLSSFFLDERVGVLDWIGFFILIAAVLVMCSYQGSIKGALDLPSILLLSLCGLANGVTDFSQKLFVRKAEGVPASVFNLYSYIAATVVLGMFLLVVLWRMPKKEQGSVEKGDAPARSLYMYVSVMALCLFLNTYFKTLAAGRLSAVALYPMSQGLSLIFSSLMAAFLFKERMTARAAIGLVLAFVALVCINLL